MLRISKLPYFPSHADLWRPVFGQLFFPRSGRQIILRILLAPWNAFSFLFQWGRSCPRILFIFCFSPYSLSLEFCAPYCLLSATADRTLPFALAAIWLSPAYCLLPSVFCLLSALSAPLRWNSILNSQSKIVNSFALCLILSVSFK